MAIRIGDYCVGNQNAVVEVVFTFLKHNGLCGRLADSNYFYREDSTLCTNFRIHKMPFACTLCIRSFLKA